MYLCFHTQNWCVSYLPRPCKHSWKLCAPILTTSYRTEETPLGKKCWLHLVSGPAPSLEEEGSGQLHITSLCCGVSSGELVQGAISNSLLIVVNCDDFLHCFGRPIRRTPYSTILCVCNTVSMCGQHEEVALMSMRIIVVSHAKKIVANIHKTVIRNWPDPSSSSEGAGLRD